MWQTVRSLHNNYKISPTNIRQTKINISIYVAQTCFIVFRSPHLKLKQLHTNNYTVKFPKSSFEYDKPELYRPEMLHGPVPRAPWSLQTFPSRFEWGQPPPTWNRYWKRLHNRNVLLLTPKSKNKIKRSAFVSLWNKFALFLYESTVASASLDLLWIPPATSPVASGASPPYFPIFLCYQPSSPASRELSWRLPRPKGRPSSTVDNPFPLTSHEPYRKKTRYIFLLEFLCMGFTSG